MNTARSAFLGAVLFAGGVIVGNLDMPAGSAQEAYPTEHKGLAVTGLGVVPEASMTAQTGLEGYFLQLRLITVAPGDR